MTRVSSDVYLVVLTNKVVGRHKGRLMSSLSYTRLSDRSFPGVHGCCLQNKLTRRQDLERPRARDLDGGRLMDLSSYMLYALSTAPYLWVPMGGCATPPPYFGRYSPCVMKDQWMTDDSGGAETRTAPTLPW